MTLTRIYTEDINRNAVTAILDRSFDGYTLLPATGRWKRSNEHSLVIELIDAAYANVKIAAAEIKTLNNQDSVLITQETLNTVEFV